MINQETKQRIYDAINIVDVIQDFVPLKRAGVSYKGSCPFHDEKTPSFIVTPSKNIYKCFGCGAGGDAVKFIMEHEKVSYPEALKHIAKKYNIEVVEKEATPDDLKAKREKESLSVILEFAKKFFVDKLKNSEEGQNIAYSYFLERGFTVETIKKFELGWSPSQRDAFTNAALLKGYKLDLLEKTGLTVVKKENNYKFDRFADRVIFPIHSISGKVTGFGGRTLRSDKNIAKYLNSPESEIYQKSRLLYGLYFSKNPIVKNNQCVLVEGYTDVISLHQKGIENVVASSGTSLTIEQVKQISRYTKNILVLFDGDAAGIKASLRGIDIILKEGMNVKVLLLPDNEDPDSFSKKYDLDTLKEYIENNQQDFIRFKTDLLLKDIKDPFKRGVAINDILKSVASVPDNLIRSEYIKQCSEMLDIKEENLYKSLNEIFQVENKKKYIQVKNHEKKSVQSVENFEKLDYSKLEFEILQILLKHGNIKMIKGDEESPYVADYIIQQFEEEELKLSFSPFQNLFELYRDEYLSKEEFPIVDFFLQHTEDNIREISLMIISDEQKKLSTIWGHKGMRNKDMTEVFNEFVPDLIERLKLNAIKIRIKELKSRIIEIDSDNEEFQILLEELNQLDDIKSKLIDYLEKNPVL